MKSGAPICGFCHEARQFLEIGQKQEGQEGSKNTSPSKGHFQGKNSKHCVASVVYSIDDHAEIQMVINVCVMESTFMGCWTAEIWRMWLKWKRWNKWILMYDLKDWERDWLEQTRNPLLWEEQHLFQWESVKRKGSRGVLQLRSWAWNWLLDSQSYETWDWAWI